MPTTFNVVKRETPPGGYDLYLHTDDSHSYVTMGGDDPEDNRHCWCALRDLADRVLARIDHPSLAQHDTEDLP